MDSLTFASKLGPITVTASDDAVTGLELGSRKKGTSDSPLLKKCVSEINEYLSGLRSDFTVPMKIEGTPFDHAVLSAMRRIGFGKTVSYAELAKQIGKPKAYRAVANACGRNRMPILIPCHRVVASHGLGGFSSGIERKKILLGIEKSKR